MNSVPLNPETQLSQMISISPHERWMVYHRLQELGIHCYCAPSQPLQAEISTPLAALQLWSVVWSLQASRPELIAHLQGCWQRSI